MESTIINNLLDEMCLLTTMHLIPSESVALNLVYCQVFPFFFPINNITRRQMSDRWKKVRVSFSMSNLST